ncbi:unnamed protein product [Ilex paraguariensis]|uniref:Uncharacterized protein n=1 Tax=Ilex paraguariensis TaxID=185542 RepID=A0ABC8R6M9_9AQUA
MGFVILPGESPICRLDLLLGSRCYISFCGDGFMLILYWGTEVWFMIAMEDDLVCGLIYWSVCGQRFWSSGFAWHYAFDWKITVTPGPVQYAYCKDKKDVNRGDRGYEWLLDVAAGAKAKGGRRVVEDEREIPQDRSLSSCSCPGLSLARERPCGPSNTYSARPLLGGSSDLL